MNSIASLATDAAELPGAATEVAPEQAEVWLRGADVTIEALREIQTGLGVLGFHTRYGPAGRYLHLNRPVFPDELASMSFDGSPIFVLSGCTTATQTTRRGVEFSFVPALLMAGASAVVAYRWSIADQEAKHATQTLLQGWPTQNPVSWVRDTISRLIEEGEPAHVWGAINIS